MMYYYQNHETPLITDHILRQLCRRRVGFEREARTGWPSISEDTTNQTISKKISFRSTLSSSLILCISAHINHKCSRQALVYS